MAMPCTNDFPRFPSPPTNNESTASKWKIPITSCYHSPCPTKPPPPTRGVNAYFHLSTTLGWWSPLAKQVLLICRRMLSSACLTPQWPPWCPSPQSTGSISTGTFPPLSAPDKTSRERWCLCRCARPGGNELPWRAPSCRAQRRPWWRSTATCRHAPPGPAAAGTRSGHGPSTVWTWWGTGCVTPSPCWSGSPAAGSGWWCDCTGQTWSCWCSSGRHCPPAPTAAPTWPRWHTLHRWRTGVAHRDRHALEAGPWGQWAMAGDRPWCQTPAPGLPWRAAKPGSCCRVCGALCQPPAWAWPGSCSTLPAPLPGCRTRSSWRPGCPAPTRWSVAGKSRAKPWHSGRCGKWGCCAGPAGWRERNGCQTGSTCARTWPSRPGHWAGAVLPQLPSAASCRTRCAAGTAPSWQSRSALAASPSAAPCLTGNCAALEWTWGTPHPWCSHVGAQGAGCRGRWSWGCGRHGGWQRRQTSGRSSQVPHLPKLNSWSGHRCNDSINPASIMTPFITYY